MSSHLEMSVIKKNTMALALAGATLGLASGAALAQSSVTVFGQIALGLTKATKTQVATTGFGSGIGFRGSEDLGDGLSAFFHIENRFDADTGKLGATFWDEKSVVGLSGGFGKVQLGRFANAFDDISGMADPFGDTVANMGHESALAETKWNNAVGYYTPVMNGFSAAFNTATKEDKTEVPYALNLKYVNGPLAVALGYVKNGANAVNTTTLAGNYDFGAAKVYAGFTNSSNTGAGNARNAQIGVGVPVGPAGTVKAAYSSYKANTDLSDRENKLAVGYWHSVSKRTMLYADVARTNTKLAGSDTNVSAFDIGIFHKF